MTSAETKSRTGANPYVAFDDLFDHRRYPAGESHLELKAAAPLAPQVTIEARVTSFEDIGQILTADQLLQHNDVRATWFVPYFPFARHDRRNHGGDGFELGVALDLVRDLRIIIADPHSDVAGQLLHIPQESAVDLFRSAGVFDNDPVIVIPDAGATKKAYDWATGPVVQALKHRDPATGRLSDFEALVDDLHGAPCLIIDDLCDGGGTFLGLATALKAKNAGPLTLAVTHGLFTKGTAELAAVYDRIVTFAFANQPGADDTDDANQLDGVEYLTFQDLYIKGARR